MRGTIAHSFVMSFRGLEEVQPRVSGTWNGNGDGMGMGMNIGWRWDEYRDESAGEGGMVMGIGISRGWGCREG